MKKVFLPVIILSLLTIFTSCQNFLSGGNLKEELDKVMDYASEQEHLEINKFLPEIVTGGVHAGSSLVIYFNTAVNVNTFEYKIKDSIGEDVSDCYTLPSFSEDKKTVFIIPVLSKLKEKFEANSSVLDLQFILSKNTKSAEGGSIGLEDKFFNFKLNLLEENGKPVFEKIKYARAKQELIDCNEVYEFNSECNYKPYKSIWIDCVGFDALSGIKGISVTESFINDTKGINNYHLTGQTEDNFGEEYFEASDLGAGYKEGVFEYIFKSPEDGMINLDICLVDYCGNKSELKSVKLIKDTICFISESEEFNINNHAPLSGENSGSDQRYLTGLSQDIFWITGIDDGDVSYDDGINKVENAFTISVTYGKTPDCEEVIEMVPGLVSFSLPSDYDYWLYDTYIEVCIRDTAGNENRIKRVLPKKYTFRGITNGASNGTYVFAGLNKEKNPYYLYRETTKDDGEKLYGTNQILNSGDFSSLEVSAYSELTFYIYSYDNGIYSPVSEKICVTEENFTELLLKSPETDAPDFVITYEKQPLGSANFNLHLLLWESETVWDSAFYSIDYVGRYGTFRVNREYTGEEVVIEAPIVPLKNEDVVINFIYEKDGKFYKVTKNFNGRIIEDTRIKAGIDISDYGRRAVYKPGRKYSDFEIKNNKCAATLYFTNGGLSNEEKQKYIVQLNLTLYKSLVETRLVTKDVIADSIKSECVVEVADSSEDAVFDFDLPYLPDNTYMVYMGFTDANGNKVYYEMNYLDISKKEKNPGITIDGSEVTVYCEREIQNGSRSGNFLGKLYTNLEIFDSVSQSWITKKDYKTDEGTKDTTTIDAGGVGVFARLYVAEQIKDSDYSLANTFGEHYSNMQYIYISGDGKRSRGTFVPGNYGSYTLVGETPAFVQVIYSKDNHGYDVVDWENKCLASQKIGAAIVHPFYSYNMNWMDINIPSGNYYVIVAHYTDGSYGLVSEIQYKN